MASVTNFDTQSVRPWQDAQDDTSAQVSFPKPFVLPPRLPNGVRQLDIGFGENIRMKSAIDNIVGGSANYHVISWGGTRLNSGIINSLDLAPYNIEFLNGEVFRDTKSPSSIRVEFSVPFASNPTVVVFFNHLDLDKNTDWRLKTTATEIDQKGFTLNIDTWSDTILYGATVGWIAYPSDRPNIWSTSVNTLEVRPWDKPALLASKAITFPASTGFTKTPDVFVALNHLDINHEHGFRINAYVDKVNNKGLTWHIDTWADTIVQAAGASIITIN